MKKHLLIAIASLAALVSTTAQAGGIYVGINAPAPYVYAPPVAYVPPPPPRPIYYAPAPVAYAAPYPVYYVNRGPAYYYPAYYGYRPHHWRHYYGGPRW